MALRHARRVIVTVVGFTILIGGVAMIVTPGPGLLVIIVGLSVLAAEFVWARRLLKRVRPTGAQIGETLFGRAKAEDPARLKAGSTLAGDGAAAKTRPESATPQE